MIKKAFRKYHRSLAIILCLPLILTTLTGMGYIIFDEWFGMDDIAHFLMEIHTFEFLGLEKVYPVLNGLGLIGLLVTGITMTGLGRKRRPVQALDE